MRTEEIKKAEELSTRLNAILGYKPKIQKSVPTKQAKDLSFINKLSAVDVVKMKSGKDGVNGRDGSPDSPAQIADKLNTLDGAIEAKVIKGLPDYSADIQKVNKRIDTSDLRWHGGGLSTVSHDSTLTGSGTPSSPLSVVSVGPTTYSETPVGLINSSNTVYTTLHTITTVFVLAINGQFIHPSEYTVTGAGFTMGTALDSSLSGTSFTIVYQ